MSAIILTTRGGNCGICREAFTPDELQFTHKGGENHDGFHRPCLVKWFTTKTICPLDREAVDRNSPLIRPGRIRATLVNAAYATAIGAVAAALSIAGNAVGGVAGTGVGLLASAAIVGELQLGVIGVGMVAAIAGGSLKGMPGAAIGTAVAIGAAVVGRKANLIFERKGVDHWSRKNIGAGLFIGGLFGAPICVMFPPLLELSSVALISGFAAGFFSLIRR